VAEAVANKRAETRKSREANMNEMSADQNVPDGSEVFMIWTERQFRAFNNRRREVENLLSIAQEENNKIARSEYAGRLHILLRRWHLDQRSARSLRDEFKSQQFEVLGESQAGRQYNWAQMLPHMKDEDEMFTPMMTSVETEVRVRMAGSNG